MFALLLRLFLTLTTVRAATQVFFQQLTTSDSLISPQFGSFIDEIRKNGSIPGISIGVVRLDNEQKPVVQLGSWGQKTENGDGHDLTPDVRNSNFNHMMQVLHRAETYILLRADAIWSCLVLESVPCDFSRAAHRRLRAWAQQDSPSPWSDSLRLRH